MEETHRSCMLLYRQRYATFLDTVSSEGFLQMVNEFEPRYKPPGRKALTTHYLPRLYQQQLDRVKALLSNSRYSISFAMTTDIWSSRANNSYVCYTFHYILDDGHDFLLKSHLLEVKNFPDSHTGENNNNYNDRFTRGFLTMEFITFKFG